MKDDIPFNVPAVLGTEQRYIHEALASRRFAGDGPFGERCSAELRSRLGADAVLMTHSCTGALEMAALLCDLGPGDEVIVPSFAFTSTALAFVRAGADVRFVDVDPATMTLDPQAVAAAVTSATRVIVVLHYGGVACDMRAIGAIAEEHDLLVVEDAAHAVIGTFGERALGTIGTFGCLSFHESKNLHCGEGGALLVNDLRYLERAEIVLEKGTDRRRFFRGEIDRYCWRDVGSSYVPGELNCAFLLAQLRQADIVTGQRLESWSTYDRLLRPLAGAGRLELPDVPAWAGHNAHTYWIKLADGDHRAALQGHLADRGIRSHIHYVPLHSAPAGRRFGRFVGPDRYTSVDAERLLRLPLYYGFERAPEVVDAIAEWLVGT